MLQWKGKLKLKKSSLEKEFSLSEQFYPLFVNIEENLNEGTKIHPYSINKYKKMQFSGSISDEFKNNNVLFHGDNLHVLFFLKENLSVPIDLIYIDPPFMKNTSFFRQVYLRGIENEISYKQKQYSDKWDLESYLQFLYDRFFLLKELMRETGSIYVHLDEDAAHYIKIILDEVFGRENFRRQIIWNTASLNVAGFKGQVRDNFIYATGIILFYSRSDTYTFHPQFTPHSQEFIDKKYTKSDENGKFRITRRNNKIYIKEDPGEPITNIWNDILSFNYAKIASRESVFYPTQKPEALLERIIKTSSNPGDLVLDCFSGSGTTATVAQNLDRKWIACDNNSNAIHTSSKRLQRVIKKTDAAQKERYFQIWRQNLNECRIDSVNLNGKRDESKIIITFTNIDENLIYEKAGGFKKKGDFPSYSLIDSIYFCFSLEPDLPQPFTIHFSDIPSGRKESVEGKYVFTIPSWIKDGFFTHIQVYDIFGNCHYCRLEF